MQKSQRDTIMNRLGPADRQNFRRVLQEFKTRLKTDPHQRVPARQILDTCGEELHENIRTALESLVARDEMGPKIGETPPDFNLKRMGSEERIRLSSFQGQRPVGLIFGSYT